MAAAAAGVCKDGLLAHRVGDALRRSRMPLPMPLPLERLLPTSLAGAGDAPFPANLAVEASLPLPLPEVVLLWRAEASGAVLENVPLDCVRGVRLAPGDPTSDPAEKDLRALSEGSFEHAPVLVLLPLLQTPPAEPPDEPCAPVGGRVSLQDFLDDTGPVPRVEGRRAIWPMAASMLALLGVAGQAPGGHLPGDILLSETVIVSAASPVLRGGRRMDAELELLLSAAVDEAAAGEAAATFVVAASVEGVAPNLRD